MAAPTNLAEAFNKTLANGEPSTHGTSRKKRFGLLSQAAADVPRGQGTVSA
jgi:hypothetical protein